MLDVLRQFMSRLRDGEAEAPHFEDGDVRLALAALLVHLSMVDGKTTTAETDRIRNLLSRNFGLTGGDLDLLIEDATAAEQEAIDLYRFTSVLKRAMTEEERVRVIENLWEIVYADDKSHEFEENVVWRVAELLGVNRRDRIATKRSVAENKSFDDNDTR